MGGCRPKIDAVGILSGELDFLAVDGEIEFQCFDDQERRVIAFGHAGQHVRDVQEFAARKDVVLDEIADPSAQSSAWTMKLRIRVAITCVPGPPRIAGVA